MQSIDFDLLEQIMDWYGEFCLKHNFLMDYKIMTLYLLERIYYSAHSSSNAGREIRKKNKMMMELIDQKLKILKIS